MSGRRWLALAALLTLGACTEHLYPVAITAPKIAPASATFDAELATVAVRQASRAERTGAMPAGLEMIVPQWRSALEDALGESGVFRPKAARRLTLDVTILSFDLPRWGEVRRTRTEARYVLTDTANGAVLNRATIVSDGEAGFGAGFLGETRNTESVTQAVQDSVRRYVEKLKGLAGEALLMPFVRPAP